MNKIKDHIDMSKMVIRCKSCKSLKIIRYLGDILCEKCEKQYRTTLANIMH